MQFIQPSTSPLASAIYYVSEWLLSVTKEEARQRKTAKISKHLYFLVKTCFLESVETANALNLPCKKVARSYISLVVSSLQRRSFFILICYAESVFTELLTDISFCFHGDRLHRTIFEALTEDTFLINLFKKNLPTSVSNAILGKVIGYSMQKYSRMRGKDIVRRFMSTSRKSLKLYVRQKSATVSNITFRSKRKSSSEVQERLNYIAIDFDDNEI